MTAADYDDTIGAAASDRLGFAWLWPGQCEAVTAVVAGRDTLAVLPTGGGKSAIYQLAGALIDGPTVVVSPLIALQHDQVDREHAHAAFLSGEADVIVTMLASTTSSRASR